MVSICCCLFIVKTINIRGHKLSQITLLSERIRCRSEKFTFTRLYITDYSDITPGNQNSLDGSLKSSLHKLLGRLYSLQDVMNLFRAINVRFFQMKIFSMGLSNFEGTFIKPRFLPYCNLQVRIFSQSLQADFIRLLFYLIVSRAVVCRNAAGRKKGSHFNGYLQN